MRLAKQIRILGATLALGTVVALAQDAGPGGRGRGPRPGGPGGPGGPAGRPGFPPNPLYQVLDADHDGTISAKEIANAANALKKLDKNKDGQLTRDELRPPRRPGMDRPQRGRPGQNGAPNRPNRRQRPSFE